MITLYYSGCIAYLAGRIATISFVFITGVIQGRTTGTYPTVGEWASALRYAMFSVGRISGRHSKHERRPGGR